jgi:tRNA dimethylallyltransferase
MQRTHAPTLPAGILIAGPTASGKSGLALALARAFGGVVINTDSMQVYADLRRLSARPSAAETELAPHRLYGHVDGAVNYSAGHFAREAEPLIRALRTEGRLPIFVGGTGLYFRALEEGLSELPPVPDDVRSALRARAEGRATEDLHADLAACDPAGAAALRPSDRARVMRALEVFAATGRPIAAFHGARTPGPLAGLPLLKLFLAPERETLHRAIDARFEASGRGPARPAPRPDAADHARPRGAGPDRASRRDPVPGGGDPARAGRHPALRQAPVHLVPAPDGRRLAVDAARGGPRARAGRAQAFGPCFSRRAMRDEVSQRLPPMPCTSA